MSDELRQMIVDACAELLRLETKVIEEAAADTSGDRNGERYKLLQGFGPVGHSRRQLEDFLAAYNGGQTPVAERDDLDS